MLAKERFHDMRLIGLVAALHHRLERSGTGAWLRQLHQRGKGQRGRALEIARHQETAGRQGRQRAFVELASLEVGGEAFRETPYRHFVGFGVRIDRGSQLAPALR